MIYHTIIRRQYPSLTPSCTPFPHFKMPFKSVSESVRSSRPTKWDSHSPHPVYVKLALHSICRGVSQGSAGTRTAIWKIIEATKTRKRPDTNTMAEVRACHTNTTKPVHTIPSQAVSHSHNHTIQSIFRYAVLLMLFYVTFLNFLIVPRTYGTQALAFYSRDTRLKCWGYATIAIIYVSTVKTKNNKNKKTTKKHDNNNSSDGRQQSRMCTQYTQSKQ